MVTMMEAAFWLSAALLFYGYAGYPLLLMAVARVLDRGVRTGAITPRVSLLIAAYNEEDGIAERLENALSSDYPRDRLEVIVASDGSTDRTEAIVRDFPSERVRLLSLPRRGKIHALDQAARRAQGEILVFSDANTVFEPDALRALVRNFADPGVGGVAGRTVYRVREACDAAGRGEDLYWRYDTWLKRLESRTGSVVSAHGGMYAVRRELVRPVEDAAVTDDFAISSGVVAQGARLVFEPAARAHERTMEESAGEFRRRVRLMTRGLRGVLLRKRLLDPFRHGFYAVSLFSRKVLRRLLPLALPVLLLSSIALRGEGVAYAGAAAAQSVFYLLAAAGWKLRGQRAGRSKLLYVPFFYCLANLASLAAVWNVLRGERIERWSPQRHEARDPEDAPDEDPRPPAIVVGLDCPTGLQTARILSGRGIPVIGIAADSSHPCARTRVCSEVVQADPAGPELLDMLDELAARLDGPGALIPCTDLSVLQLARHRASLPSALRLVLPETDVLETLLDKARFQAFARERGFAIPETRLLRSRKDAEAAAAIMRFPCVLKPPVKTPEWERRAGAKVFKARSPDLLLALYDRYADVTDVLVVQEWVDGPDPHHVTCNCYIGRDGEPLVSFTTRKLRQWPLEGGQACLSEECRSETVREETVRLLRDAGHRGFGYLETKWDPGRGRHLVLEANVGRPTGRSATAEAAGVELLLTAYRDALGLPPPEERAQHCSGVKWIHLRHDLQAALSRWRRGDLDVRGWIRSLRGPKTYAMFSWRDPVPFLADLGRTAGKVISGHRPPAADATSPALDSPDATVPGLEGQGSTSPALDFDVAGVATVRLMDPTPADARIVRRLLGPPRDVPNGEPRVAIRFVDRLETSGLRLVEGGRSGYSDEDFFLLRSPAGGPRARLRLGDGQEPAELVCLRDAGGIPLLRELVDLAALERGWIPLHASAWIHRDVGVLAAGWDRSGKTGCLLGFADAGASFVGDDRVFVHRSGETMTGIPRPVTVRAWHLARLPRLRAKAGFLRRSLAGAGPWLESVQSRLRGSAAGGSLPARILKRGLGRIRRRLAMELRPDEIFGPDGVPCEGEPGVVFLLLTHDADDIRIEPVDREEVVQRLAATVRAELQPLVDTHLAMRFADPGHRWTRLDRAHERAANLLREALADKEINAVRHPYPCSLADLRRAMETAIPRTPPTAPADGPTAPDGGRSAAPVPAGVPGPVAERG